MDVLLFAELNNLELLGYVFQGVGEGKPKDPRIHHFHIPSVDIDTDPSKRVLTGGDKAGDGRAHLEARLRVLAAMAWPETQIDI